MTRRAFLGTLAGGLLAAPLAAEGQPAGKPPRIGWLSAGSQPDPFLEGFREGLRRLGYVEGQTIAFEIRHAQGSLEALGAGAVELAQSSVVLIVASLTAIRATRALKDIPILFTISGDPVEAGLVRSLSRPGGNLTGITFLSLEVAGKRVEFLKQALPRFGEALETIRRAQPDAMVVFPEGATMANRLDLANFGIAQRLPSIFGWSEYADAGGLMSYGASQRDTHARLAIYADKILKGAKPGDLPIEQPTKFELVINLKTAKALGLTIPQSLLQRADQVIE